MLRYCYTLLCCLPLCLCAQGDCPEYRAFLQKASEAATQKTPDFDLALKCYDAAILAAADCQQDKTEEVNDSLRNLFRRIDALRIRAEQSAKEAREAQAKMRETQQNLIVSQTLAIRDRNDAIKAKNEAMHSDSIAQKERELARAEQMYALKKSEEAEAARREAVRSDSIAQEALKTAKNIIESMYWYDDRLALAYRNGKFGFINKKGEIVLGYNYDKALPFDERGFAQVEIKNDKNEFKKYLIDTAGNYFVESVAALDGKASGLLLRDQNLKTLPKDLWEKGSGLRFLLLGNNDLTELPEEIAALQALEVLELGNNNLTELPVEIAALQALEVLELGNNNLTKLPKEIGNLENLHTLSLSGNPISRLPESLARLPKLKHLYLPMPLAKQAQELVKGKVVVER